MPTVKFEIAFTAREFELLVAAKSDKPHPSRIKAMLVDDARSTLRRMISMVDDERMSGGTAARGASFGAKSMPKPVATRSTPAKEKLAPSGGNAARRVRIINEGYYGLDSKALDKQHEQELTKLREDNGRQRASVNRAYQAGKYTSAERDQALATIDRREKLTLKRAVPFKGKSSLVTKRLNHSDRSAQPEWLSDDNVKKLQS